MRSVFQVKQQWKMPATIAAAASGVDNENHQGTLSPLVVKHLQFVDQINMLNFYNEGKSNLNILATQKPCLDLTQQGYLDCWWVDRGNEFDELVPDITGLKKIGHSRSICRTCQTQRIRLVAYVDATDIADATRALANLRKGCLFSPVPPMRAGICMLTFEVRGDLFIDTVAELKG